MDDQRPSPATRVVVVGGGFGGMSAVRHLASSPVADRLEITLLDRSTTHVFQPLLYQCATGVLSTGSITRPLRAEFADDASVRTLLGEAHAVDAQARTITAARSDGTTFDLGYDQLVVATGTQQAYFGHPEYRRLAPGMKTIDDAAEIRRRVFSAFEMAETLPTAEERAPWLTFVVTGGGPTGVELAGQIRELATHTLNREFRTIDSAEARVVLVHGGNAVLEQFGPSLARKATAALEHLGVELVLGAHVTGVTEEGVEVTAKDGPVSHHAARTVLWTAGQEATPFARTLAQALGAQTDHGGRLKVRDDLTVEGHRDVFVIGDLIDLRDLPGLAEVAMQGGRHVARSITATVEGRSTDRTRFRYRDLGSAAYIARGQAVVSAGPLRLSGRLGWVAWGFIHIAFLTGFSNRASTLAVWFLSIAGARRTQRALLSADVEAAPQPYRTSDGPAA